MFIQYQKSPLSQRWEYIYKIKIYLKESLNFKDVDIIFFSKLKNLKNIKPFMSKVDNWFVDNKYTNEIDTDDPDFKDQSLFEEFKNFSGYVLKFNGKYIGIVITQYEHQFLKLKLIYIKKEFRNKGILKHLINNQFKNNNIKLGVHKDNINAKTAYKKLGFKLTKNKDNSFRAIKLYEK